MACDLVAYEKATVYEADEALLYMVHDNFSELVHHQASAGGWFTEVSSQYLWAKMNKSQFS